MDARLLNTGKQDVFEVIRQGELDPFAFEWKDAKSSDDSISRLVFKGQPTYYFDFDVSSEGKWWPRCSPFGGRRDVRFSATEWPSLLGLVGRWINDLKKELNTPDPWEALPSYTGVAELRVSPQVANNQFTFTETEQVAKALGQIRKLMLEHIKGSKAHEQLLDQQLTYLIDSSKRMGRKDWFNLAIGALINLAMAIALPQEVTKQVFEILRDSLGGIVHFLPIIAAGQQLIG